MDNKEDPWRQYLVVNWQADGPLAPLFRDKFDSQGLHGDLARHLGFPSEEFDVLAPAVWPPSLKQGGSDAERALPERMTLPLGFGESEHIDRFREVFESYRKNNRDDHMLLGVGSNNPIYPADYCCPHDVSGVLTGKRKHALSLIRLDALRASLSEPEQAEIDGHDVNVVLIDEGIDGTCVPAAQRGDGWSVAGASPWMTPSSQARHSTMMIRNILSIAPKARLFDMPLIQKPKYGDLVKFIDAAHVAFELAFADIKNWLATGKYPGPWVLVNAWAPFDLRREHPKGDYSNGPLNQFHQLMNSIITAGIDVVFCAGNCGAFCPDGRCGPNDTGPGRSILGAASYSRVISVGAIRVDGMWIGYSSQGPGQSKLSSDKPDICAPSGFAEDHDRFAGNIGTSAACGVAAGVIAALRTKWNPGKVHPDNMRFHLRSTAHGNPGIRSQRQYGEGILDIKAAYERLRLDYP